jgi:hypothetical protein
MGWCKSLRVRVGRLKSPVRVYRGTLTVARPGWPRLTTAVSLLLPCVCPSVRIGQRVGSMIRGGVLRKTVTEIDVEVRDYLVPLTDVQRSRRYRRNQSCLKAGCFHPRLRQCTLSDVKTDALTGITTTKTITIKMCPDCTTFDARRHSALCNGQPLTTCMTVAMPLSNEEFARTHHDKFMSFDGKTEGPFSCARGRDIANDAADCIYIYFTVLPPKMGKDSTKVVWGIRSEWEKRGKRSEEIPWPAQRGIPTTRNIRTRDDLRLNQSQWDFCRGISVRRFKDVDVREPALTYSKSVLYLIDGAPVYNPIGVRLQDRERKPKPVTQVKSGSQRGIVVGEMQSTPWWQCARKGVKVAKVEPEWVVVPLPCTRLVKSRISFTTQDWHDRLRYVYERPWGGRHKPERETGGMAHPKLCHSVDCEGGFAFGCQWMWPEFVEQTFDKRRVLGKTRDILADDEVEPKKAITASDLLVYKGTPNDLSPIEHAAESALTGRVRPKGHGPDEDTFEERT